MQDKSLLMEGIAPPGPPNLDAGRRFSMTWKPGQSINSKTGQPWSAEELKTEHRVRDAHTLTSCSMCHR